MRIGFDLVSVDEIEESIRVHGARFLERVYTSQELRDCGGDCRRLAAAFATKEATMKVLRQGDEPLAWSSIALAAGAPGAAAGVVLDDHANRLARRRGLSSLSVTITHRRRLAAALVLAS
jgi:holo-[acyl-carrier protein] synthase